MPHGLRNWVYKDLTTFLEKNGFVILRDKKGSHEMWHKKEKGSDILINVNFTTGSYPIRTLETMIRQSKIDKKIWRNWSGK